MTEGRSRESILVADCGNANTRVMLLDVVAGRYRFIAGGQAPSTGRPPTSDITAGLTRALAELEGVTARPILGPKGQLVVSSEGEVGAVDMFVATTSAARPLRLVVTGLMDDVSLASAQRVANSTYANVLDVIGLGDSRPEDELVRTLVELKPDLFLITGGTDGGAADRVIRTAEIIAMTLSLLGSPTNPPTVIYAGNAELRPVIAEILSSAQLRAADNVRPRIEVEYLDSAQAELNALYEDGRLLELGGADEMRTLAEGVLMPTAKAFGRTVQYLGEVLGPQANVIGVDVGSASVTMGAVVDRSFQLSVRSDLGIGHNLPHLLDLVEPRHVLRWLPREMTPDELKDYVINKGLFPLMVPLTTADLHLELALARELIRALLPVSFPERFGSAGVGLLPPVEMILATGAVLAHVPRPGQAALVLLDALQPVGLCTLTLDTQGLAAALGAVASILPMATVQVIESGAFRELGAVVAPIGQANAGDVVLHLKMIYQNGSELEVEVEFGSLEVLPLPAGQSAELHLRPLKRFDVGAGPGRSCRRRVYGGAVGLIVDARGRPLRLPADPVDRQSRIQQWLWDMGG